MTQEDAGGGGQKFLCLLLELGFLKKKVIQYSSLNWPTRTCRLKINDLFQCNYYLSVYIFLWEKEHTNKTIFAGPKRDRPTPGFSIFIHSDRGMEGQRDKKTKGQHINIGTKRQKIGALWTYFLVF